uniref:hypothetical protein n=1 Tax=Sneathiella chinensis TaxID=349750 RepID=UPI00146E3B99
MATSDNNTTTVLVTKSESMVTVQEGAVIQIPFGTVEEVILSQDGGNLVITPLGGGEPLTLENFFVAGETSAPASLQIGENGPILTVDQIIGLTEDFNPDAIAPAAGPAAGGAGGGGAGFSAYNDDGIGDGIGIENLLDPTELEFQTREEEEFLQGEEADEADGTIDLTFLSTDPEGELSPISGGYEDWQPYQNFGSGYTVPMQVFANFTPADDETISEITLSGFPEGARFFVGGTDAANEVAIVDGSVTISAVDGVLPPLFMLPPANSDADIPLSVSADIVDASGETAVITGEGTVIVDAAADAVSLSVSSEPMTGGNGNDFGYGNGDYQYPPQVPDANVYCSHEDAAFTVDVSAQFGDNVDGSESHTVVVEIPAGWTVSDGAGGVWAPGADGTSGTLTFTVPVGPGQSGAFNASPSFLPPEDFSGSADFVVRAVAEENPSDGELVVENNVAIAQETISVNVVPEADDPVFELTGVSLQNGLYMTKEDNSVDIGFSVKTGEYAKNPGATDGSENLSFVAISGFGGWTVSGDDITAIENMPEVWGVSQSGSELHIWFNPGVETFDLSGLTLTPPEDSDADIDLGNLVFKVSVNDQGVDCYGNPNDGYDNAYEEYESGIVVDAVLDQYAEVS